MGDGGSAGSITSLEGASIGAHSMMFTLQSRLLAFEMAISQWENDFWPSNHKLPCISLWKWPPPVTTALLEKHHLEKRISTTLMIFFVEITVKNAFFLLYFQGTTWLSPITNGYQFILLPTKVQLSATVFYVALLEWNKKISSSFESISFIFITRASGSSGCFFNFYSSSSTICSITLRISLR